MEAVTVWAFESKYPKTVLEMPVDGKRSREVAFIGGEFVTSNEALAKELQAREDFGKEEGQGTFWLLDGIKGANKAKRGRPRVHSGGRGTDN